MVCGKLVMLVIFLHITFTDASLRMWFDRERAYHEDSNQGIIFINVTCEVDRADGIPDMSLSYFGNKRTEVKRINKETRFEDHGNYVHGILREEMRLPTTGHVFCRTTDASGTYDVYSPIVTYVSECPKDISVRVIQLDSAHRPQDEVVLICVLTDVSRRNLTYYWWMDVTDDSAVYRFSDIHKIDEITTAYQGSIKREEHTINELEIITELTLLVNMTSHFDYKCEFKFEDIGFCSDSILINFLDPSLRIWFDRDILCYENHHHDAIIINVTCEVDAADGIPDMSLSYIGNNKEKVRRINKAIHFIDYGNHVYGMIREVMRLPSAGQVRCLTTDARGQYKKDKPIVTHDPECSKSEDCAIGVKQDDLACRPEDEIVLKCVFDGIPRRNLIYYWWTDVTDNVPVYTFSDIYKMDEITTAYQGSIIKEKHTFNELEIITELTLLVNMTSHFDYKCEFLFDDIGYCNDIISIQFVDPQISISFDEEPRKVGYSDRGSVREVVCSIKMASGKPTFNLRYRGSRIHQVEKIHNTTISRQNNAYSFEAIMRLPHTGSIICMVSDLIGDYTVIRKINGREVASTTPVKKTNCEFYLLFLLLLLVLPFMLYIVKRIKDCT